jgi:UDP-N-acetylglucosamine diphosphorylase/glucosamine-1-phosphate N-acetyltransferase
LWLGHPGRVFTGWKPVPLGSSGKEGLYLMRLILIDRSQEIRSSFYPIALGRPLWELRCGISSLGEKLAAKCGSAILAEFSRAGSPCHANNIADFVPDYMAEPYRAKVQSPVNDLSVLAGDDLLIVDPLVKVQDFDIPAKGPSEVGLDSEGRILYVRVARGDLAKIAARDIDSFPETAKMKLPNVSRTFGRWQYIWELILANPEQIAEDFMAAGRSGIEGTIEQPNAIRGSSKDVYIAPGAVVHPMVVIDAQGGPVYIDEGAEIQPFSRVEGPCYIGRKSVLIGAKCRAGNSIGAMCRIGGEVEGSIIQGFSNKYHDGFIGHSYIGEWVNLGALTTNSDLKNDYSTVSVMLDGGRSICTGSTKVGSLIGDHTKTSIGTLLNTGSYLGAMAIIMATGKPLPKFIPSFAWFVEGIVTKGFGKKRLYEAASVVMSRRGCEWTQAEEAMWDAVWTMTAQDREKAIKKGRWQNQKLKCKV